MVTRFPILKTENYLLRRFASADFENLINGLGNPNVYQYYGVKTTNIKEAYEQLEWFKELEEEKKGIWWAITSLDGNMFYGGVGFNDYDAPAKTIEVGFWLLEEHWRKGIMTALMPLTCEHIFNNFNVTRIEGFVETENMGCKKALEKLGFTYEKTEQDAEIKDGKSINIDTYSYYRF